MDDRPTEYTQTYIPSTNPKKPQEIVKMDEFEELLHLLPDHTTSIQTASTLTGIKKGCMTNANMNYHKEITETLESLNIPYLKILDQLLFTRDREHLEQHLNKLDGTDLSERYTPLSRTQKDLGEFLGVKKEDLMWWEDYENPPDYHEYSEYMKKTPPNWDKKHLIHDTGIQLRPKPTSKSLEYMINEARKQKQLTLYLFDEHDISEPIDTLLSNQIEREIDQQN